jgi:hypothetical protein
MLWHNNHLNKEQCIAHCATAAYLLTTVGKHVQLHLFSFLRKRTLPEGLGARAAAYFLIYVEYVTPWEQNRFLFGRSLLAADSVHALRKLFGL